VYEKDYNDGSSYDAAHSCRNKCSGISEEVEAESPAGCGGQ